MKQISVYKNKAQGQYVVTNGDYYLGINNDVLSAKGAGHKYWFDYATAHDYELVDKLYPFVPGEVVSVYPSELALGSLIEDANADVFRRTIGPKWWNLDEELYAEPVLPFRIIRVGKAKS